MKRVTACFAVVIILITCCFNMFVYADIETPVIIVPGYMGSKLYADADFNERVFGEYGNAAELLTVPEGEHFVKEPVNLQKAAEYGAGNKYKALCNALCQAYPKRKIYFFSYDFTKGTKEAAASLNNFINSIGGKVNIVCYSYGGMVATHYFALDDNNFNKVEKTVCIGVPFEGSTYAQLAVDKQLIGSNDVNELLPTKKYLEKTDGAGEGGANQGFLYSDGRPVMLKNKNAYYAIGGNKITASNIVYKNGEIADILFDNNGDGTVSRLSATMLDELKDNVRYFDLSHGKLITSDLVINWVKSVIDGNSEAGDEPGKNGYDVIKINGNASITISGAMGVMEQEGIMPVVTNEYGQMLKLDEKNTIAAVVRSESSITLKGNDNGFVNLYIRRFDENNKMICDNAFMDVPVNSDTVIKTVVSDDDMWLYIDLNNDGVFEENAHSGKNGEYSFVTKAAVPTVKEGKYNKAVTVKLESETPDADIYYTLDGTDPIENGTLYAGEFEVGKTCVLKTVTIKENYTTGNVAEYHYEINKLGIILTVVLWLVLVAVVIAVVIMVRKRKTQQRKKGNGLQDNIL